MAHNRHSPKVSRHTMVMRRAKDEDARRVSEREDDGIVLHADPVRPSARLTARGASCPLPARPAADENGRSSARLSSRSTRVDRGDTIIRYQSGEVVVKRGVRRATFRQQMLTVYAVGYLALFGLFVYWLLTGAVSMTPQQFIDRAFARRHGESIIDLERAAIEAARGNRTPAEMRLAQNLTFYDDDRNTVTVDKGNRLTLLKAAQLGRAVLADMKREPALREFQAPFAVYKEGHLANVDWPHLLTIYNSIGFFLLLGLFLWRPLVHYLGTQGKKTAVAIRNARDAEETAADYRNRYRALAGEIGERDLALRVEMTVRLDKEREEALDNARRQAEDIAGGIKGALDRDVLRHARGIGLAAATAACEEAREMLRNQLGQADHDAAVEELIAGIAGMRPAS